MSYTKRFVCLAASFKADGRCIAGVELLPDGSYGGWIRPVSNRPYAELTQAESRYSDGTAPKLLDILDVPLHEPAPRNHQLENHLINPAGQWIKRGELPHHHLRALQDCPASLWINGEHTRSGKHDCLAEADAEFLGSSLFLISVSEFIVCAGPSLTTGKRSLRGEFDYKGTTHNLSLTDPAAHHTFRDATDGRYPMDDVYLCISLTEPYRGDNRCHKVVAAIFNDPPL